MPILLPRFICIRSNISSQISDNTLRKIKFLGSYWKSHLCVSDSQSIIFRYQGWDKQKHWIQTERWNLGCQVINYALINQSINQSINALGGQASHWVGLSRAVPQPSKRRLLYLYRYFKSAAIIWLLSTNQLEQFQFGTISSSLFGLSLSPFNISISSNSHHHHKYVGQRSLNCTNVRESCDFVKLVNLPFCNFVFVGAKRTNRNVFF